MNLNDYRKFANEVSILSGADSVFDKSVFIKLNWQR